MPAHNSEFPWMSYYGGYSFFEDRMAQHDGVDSIESVEDGQYTLTRSNGQNINVFICECYCFCVAEYMETVANIGRQDAIIINGNWCDYTDEVKKHCRDDGVGVFTIRGFMAALNRPDFQYYLEPDEKELFRNKGWL